MTALTFPLSLAAFYDTLGVASCTFEDTLPIETSQMADGTILKASLGASLWRGTLNLVPRTHADAQAIEALVSVLKRPGSSFLARDPRRVGPKLDPTGSTLGANTVQINSLNVDNRQLSLKGLPASYVISVGDMLSFTYGSSPTRYALHRVVEAATANGSGVTPEFEVTPLIRSGAAVDATVTLVKPVCKAVLLQGVSYGTTVRTYTEGMSFEFIQTLR
jgi:hypothetical protein